MPGPALDRCDVKRLTLLLPLVLAIGPAFAVDEAANAPATTKAECDAVLTAEVKRLEDGFSRTRVAWEQSVEQRFHDHPELTSAQEKNARETFEGLVVKMSNEHVKAVALPVQTPVYLTYITAAATDRGVAFRDDVYGRDG